MLLTVLVLGVMTTLLVYVNASSREVQKRMDLDNGIASQRLDQAAAMLKLAYHELAGTMDSTASAPVTAAQLLDIAGVPDEWHLRLQIGSRRQQTPLAWRNLYVWSPPTEHPDTTTYDATTDTFTPDPDARWRVVDGRQIQERFIEDTAARLQKIGHGLKERFFVLTELDPLHDPTVNRFQQGVVNGGYITLAAMGMAQAIGLSAEDQKDAWGGTILASNTVDCNTVAPPYDMVLRSVAPWGTVIDLRVVQP